MLDRTRNLIKFRLERLLLRGAGMRLLLIAALIGSIAVGAGTIVHLAARDFDGIGEAVWWAFLRLTDPGYLGDDQGAAKRLIATVVTVAGYVVFLGALVAIMTQWLNQTIRRLESGFTPIAINDHVLVVGNTSRTVTILGEMLRDTGRVRRFLERHGARSLNVVMLVDEVDPGLRFDLREQLGLLYSDRRIVLRSGTPLRVEHLRRVDFLNAAVILLPSDDQSSESAAASDTRTIKALLSMSRRTPELAVEEMPLVVAEILDVRKVPVALRAYGGPLELVASDMLVGCMLAQAVLFHGVSGVFAELLVHVDGQNLHVIHDESLTGTPFGELERRFPHGILVGFVRKDGRSFAPILAPSRERALEHGEAMVVIAGSHEDAMADASLEDVEPVAIESSPPPKSRIQRRVLILGWSSHVPSLVTELAGHGHAEIALDVASVVPAVERSDVLETYGEDLEAITIRQLEVDFTVPAALRRLDPGSYDDVVIVASDWPSSDEEADARTIVGYLLLRELLRKSKRRPRIVVELSDPSNARLFEERDVEVLATPVAVGQILAQVSLRPELRAVFENMLGLRGAELSSYAPADFGFEGGEVSFRRLSEVVGRRDGILLGLYAREATGWQTHLNPPRASRWQLEDGVRFIVLTDETH